jgi:hypothetical protein
MELSLHDFIFIILEILKIWNQSNEYKISKNILYMILFSLYWKIWKFEINPMNTKYPKTFWKCCNQYFFKQFLTKNIYYNFLKSFENDFFLTYF